MKVFGTYGTAVLGLIVCLSNAAPLVAANPPAPADFLIDHGAARITTTDEHTVRIAFKGNEGRVRHVFNVGIESVIARMDARLSAVTVEYRGSEIVLMDANEQTFYRFAVAGHDAEVRAPRGFSNVSYTAVGLNHTIYAVSPQNGSPRGGETSLVDDCWDCESGPDMPDYGWDAGGSSSCSQGGQGATSCSVEALGFSCSVSCSAGYYACCSVNKGCKCVRGT